MTLDLAGNLLARVTLKVEVASVTLFTKAFDLTSIDLAN
jgi:hypothetical protein